MRNIVYRLFKHTSVKRKLANWAGVTWIVVRLVISVYIASRAGTPALIELSSFSPLNLTSQTDLPSPRSIPNLPSWFCSSPVDSRPGIRLLLTAGFHEFLVAYPFIRLCPWGTITTSLCLRPSPPLPLSRSTLRPLHCCSPPPRLRRRLTSGTMSKLKR